MASASDAVAPAVCDLTLMRGEVKGGIKVPDGKTCNAEGLIVSGPVDVGKGADLMLMMSSVSGDITVAGGAKASFSGVEIRGNLKANDAAVKLDSGSVRELLLAGKSSLDAIGSVFNGEITGGGPDVDISLLDSQLRDGLSLDAVSSMTVEGGRVTGEAGRN